MSESEVPPPAFGREVPPAPRRLARHLAALPKRPDSSAIRTLRRLAMHRTRRRGARPSGGRRDFGLTHLSRPADGGPRGSSVAVVWPRPSFPPCVSGENRPFPPDSLRALRCTDA